MTQYMPLNVTQIRPTMANNGDSMDDDHTTDDDTDDDDHRHARKRRRLHLTLDSSLLDELVRTDKPEGNRIPWLQIVQRLLQKFPEVFLEE